MSAIREPGRVNDSTTLIDIVMYGMAGAAAVYLVEGDRKCLVDAGTSTEAPGLIETLRGLDAFPPDVIVLTHSHFDHAQGIPILRREAEGMGRKIEVMASERALPLLADRAYNEHFDAGPYEEIGDVTPLKEGDVIDLGSTGLRVYDVPGHSLDHIAVLDERHKNILVGDAIGSKTTDTVFMPPFMPPSWNPDAFQSTIGKLKEVDYDTLCLAHFGFIEGDEARQILDEALSVCDSWWKVFDQNADRLGDIGYLAQAVVKQTGLGIPEEAAEVMLGGYLTYLVKGYEIYKKGKMDASG